MEIRGAPARDLRWRGSTAGAPLKLPPALELSRASVEFHGWGSVELRGTPWNTRGTPACRKLCIVRMLLQPPKKGDIMTLKTTRFLAFALLLSACNKDGDDDGYKAEFDCDDSDASVNPGAAETCDGISLIYET